MIGFGVIERPDPGATAASLRRLTLDDPPLAPHDVLVDVRAASINIDDIHMVEGTFFGGFAVGGRPSATRPIIPGVDVSGVVLAAGAKARDVEVGDEVMGACNPSRRTGSWATRCRVDARWLTKKPRDVSFETAAASVLVGLVAHDAIERARVEPGMRCVVVGASGGIGSMVTQLLVDRGVEVVGVCGAANVARVRGYGVERVIDHRAGSFAGAITRADRVIDCAGGSDVEAAARQVLDRAGRFVSVIGPVRGLGERPLGLTGAAWTMLRVTGRVLASWIRGPRYLLAAPSGATAAARLDAIGQALVRGLAPPIDRVVPLELEPLAAAVERVVQRRARGKIVLVPGRSA